MTIEERLAELENKFAAMSVAQQAAGDPSGYYTSIYSGEQIDAAIGNVLNVGNNPIAIKNIGATPRRNLLDNWYFVGGGSQQGGGRFPINQRGQTSYAVSGYGIDRWRTSSLDMTVAVTAEGVTLSLPAGDGSRIMFEQVLPFMLSGQMCTITILTTDGELYSGSAIFPESSYVNVLSIPGIADVRMNNRSATGDQSVYIILERGASLQIAAVKLELGPTQTLAYQDESGNWQLFETPDYGEELAKCQRYQIVYPSQGTLIPLSGYNANSLWGCIFLPEKMRITPSIGGGTIGIYGAGENISVPVSGFSISLYLIGNILVSRADKVAHGLTPYTATMQLNNLILDANL